jgi:trans-2,3-dihydro-3-hydroxyanthranilate isomerase
MEFAIVDVFGPRPFTGNPLSVVASSDELSDEEMRQIAREFNQSETTFVLRPSTSEADWRLRSFTASGSEVYGAGHNAMGAWWWLAESGKLALTQRETQFQQEIGDDILPLTVVRDDLGVSEIHMYQSAPSFGKEITDTNDLMAALGLQPGDPLRELPARVVSTGVAHLMVPLISRSAVDHALPDDKALLAVLRDAGAEGCYVFALDAHDLQADAYARFFNPTVGLWEDPGTGTAAGPLACYLHHYKRAASQVVIEQGHAMGRPSRIEISLAGDAPCIIARCVTSATGELRLRARA